jgi:transposase
MDKVEQRFVVKYFFIKEWDNNKITAELQITFHDSVLSSSTVKRWIRRFKNGDLSSDDNWSPGRPISILGPVRAKFLDRYPFPSARIISRHFRISLSTVKEILRRELGLKKFSRIWVSHFLFDGKKKLQVDASREFLSMLGMYAEHNCEGIATGDEFLFQCSSYSDSMFADSRESVVPRIRRDISGQKTKFTIFLHQSDF